MKQCKRWVNTPSPIYFAAIRFIAAWVIMLLLQVLFFLCNARLFPLRELNVFEIVIGNLMFTLATTTILLAPFVVLNTLPIRNLIHKKWYRALSETLYVAPILFAVISGCCNAPYYQFTYKRLSAQIFTYLTNSGDFGSLLPHFIVDYWEAFIGIIVLTTFLALVCLNVCFDKKRYISIYIRDSKSHKKVFSRTVAFILILFLMHITSHGGLKTKLINTSDVGRFCEISNSAILVPDALNILYTATHADIPDNLNEVNINNNLFDPIFVSAATKCTDTCDTNEKPNIVLIILESFSQEYMGCYNSHSNKSYTPFLDSLAKHAVLFDGRANGKQSIEGIPAILSSIPSWIETPYLNSSYYSTTHRSLPLILNENGYNTAFYHGGENGIMNFDKYCKDIGIQHYYGEDEYYMAGGSTDDFDGTWGIYDYPYLQYFANQLKNSPRPFFNTIYTLSSHHPYSLPDSVKKHYTEGRHPLLKCIKYTDNALREFFKSIENEPWYKNTLFIITADHSGSNISKDYIIEDGLYRIPMILYHPNNNQARFDNRIFQQTDIMPTVIDYLNIKDSSICFGTSIFQNPDHRWTITYGSGFHTFTTTKGHLYINNEYEQYRPIHQSVNRANDSMYMSQQGRTIISQYRKHLATNNQNQ